MDGILERFRSMTNKDWAIDVAVALVSFAVACVQLMLTVSSIIFPDIALRQYLGMVSVVPEFSAFVALALTTLPLVVRRVLPWPVFVFVLVLHCAFQNVYTSFALSPVGLLVALFTLASSRSIVEAVAAAAFAMLGSIFFPGSSVTPSLAFFMQVQNLGLIAAATAAGYGFRTHRAYVEAAEQRAAEAERTREEEAARRVEEERVRIASEVHDITAHSLSAVSIQTAAAERLIDRDPAAAKEAIAAARVTAKSALDDIRSMIGVLRHGDSPAETNPTAGTDRLADLADYLRKAGVACTVDEFGYDRARVPAHADLALFAIAREAVTNIVKHAGASSASIVLASDERSARMTVWDDGRGCGMPLGAEGLPIAADGGGNGIAGMAERARLLGGRLSAGDAPGGGFAVQVDVPFSVVPTGHAAQGERGRVTAPQTPQHAGVSGRPASQLAPESRPSVHPAPASYPPVHPAERPGRAGDSEQGG